MNNNLNERQFRNYTLRYNEQAGIGRHHEITAHWEGFGGTRSQRVGRLRWTSGSGGEIEGVNVQRKHQRRGLATAMWHWGQEMANPPQHSRVRTDEGDAWAQSVGGVLPPRRS